MNPEPATLRARDLAWDRKIAIRELVAAIRPLADAWATHAADPAKLGDAIKIGDLARLVEVFDKHKHA